jgi:formylglycine-generating enzyme required for sulfatase activity
VGEITEDCMQFENDQERLVAEHGVSMKLVLIPAGKFLMGSPKTEEKRDSDDGQHPVTISKAFYLGTTEVTQKQYQAVMGSNPSTLKGDDLPVEKVSWNDAVEFCKKLSQKEGKAYRLPTEAEWEYACRAGTSTPFHTGATISTDQANYDGKYTYGNGVKGVSRQKAVAVGSFKPNPWGLYDMHGNVFEWCSDWYGKYPQGEATDPTGPKQGALRVLRGGSARDVPAACRSAHRSKNSPNGRYNLIGFRVALDVP